MEEELDACDVDFDEDRLEDDPELFALFPDGPDADLENKYRELFN